jgi:hypothetical protein
MLVYVTTARQLNNAFDDWIAESGCLFIFLTCGCRSCLSLKLHSLHNFQLPNPAHCLSG